MKDNTNHTNNDNNIKTIPFAVHEAVVYVMERNVKRWMTVSALLFAVIVVMAVAIIK